jgi:amidase
MLSEYLNTKLEDLYFSQEHGWIDFTFKKYYLDAILFPFYIGSTICPKAGSPSIAVPAFEQAKNIGKAQS